MPSFFRRERREGYKIGKKALELESRQIEWAVIKYGHKVVGEGSCWDFMRQGTQGRAGIVVT